MIGWIVITAASLRHISLSISPGGLLAELKRTLGNPFAKLVLITVLDLITLSFAIPIATNRSGHRNLALEPVMSVARALISAPKFMPKLFSASPLVITHQFFGQPQSNQLTLVLGVIMYVALLRTLISKGMGGLKRDGDDCQVLADRLALQGDAAAAMTWIQQVTHPNWETYATNFKILLLQQRPAQAEASAIKMIGHDPRAIVAPTRDEAVRELLIFWPFLPSVQQETLQTYADAQDLSESVRFIINYATMRLPSADGVIPTIPRYLLKCAFMDVTAKADAKQLDEALMELEAIQPRNPPDEILKMAFNVAVCHEMCASDEEAQKYALAWMSSSLPTYQNICDSILDTTLWAQLVVVVGGAFFEKSSKVLGNDTMAVAIDAIKQRHIDNILRYRNGEATYRAFKMNV